jgi:NAD(P)-dependent dehydrogenase (short-subunit alcohol dehydrogenase family)
MVDQTVTAFGGLDILVNNAGVGKIIPFLDTTEADWDFMFDINCKGLLWCCPGGGPADDRPGAGRQDRQPRLPGRARGEAFVLAYCASRRASST